MKNNKKHFLPRGKIENCNILIDGRNWKLLTGQGDDYATGCLLDYAYFKDNYRLIALDLNKQKALDADLRAIQQIVFQGKDEQKTRLYTILEK